MKLRCLVPATAALWLMVLPGCSTSGDQHATEALHQVEDSLFREAGQNWRRGSDPAWLAIWAANDSGIREGSACASPRMTVTVEPLAWDSPDGWLGRVDLRVTVTSDGIGSCGFSGPSYGPGRAQECVRFVVGDAKDTSKRIDCDGRTPVPAPTSASTRNWPSGQPPGG